MMMLGKISEITASIIGSSDRDVNQKENSELGGDVRIASIAGILEQYHYNSNFFNTIRTKQLKILIASHK